MISSVALILLQPSPLPKVITKSIKFKPGVVLSPIEREDGTDAALVIRGKNLVVDFNGLVLRGSPETTAPNLRKGTGIRVEGENITLKNLKVHGYKVAVMAKGVKGLQVLNSDFSYNWKQKLLSTLEKEDGADWMSFHRNEKDEWLRFGAGLYLRDCDGAVIKGVTIKGGQCGLMITETDGAKILGNDFSFLSAVGLGMYQSSGNLIQQNKIDWCVRGYSHGKWNRGQDSTGILIYEQSHKNTFAYNSVTHGGDGFFLWAGQTTMDTGKGGCNDNLLIGNDFSHAPTNGIEATFSRNAFVNNLVLECWHGGWLGYSYESLVLGNMFGLNAEAIAWEHGQNSIIKSNVFHRDNQGIVLWQKKSEDPNWGYPKFRDTSSKNNRIEKNTFFGIPQYALNLRNTKGVSVLDSVFNSNGRLLSIDADAQPVVWKNSLVKATPENWAKDTALHAASGLRAETGVNYQVPQALMQGSGNVILGLDPRREDYLARFKTSWDPKTSPKWQKEVDALYKGSLPKIPAWRKDLPNPFIKQGETRGRRWILVDDWGPLDFQSPRLWPRSQTSTEKGAQVTFEILGPEGTWTAEKVPGLILDQNSGKVPGMVTATFPPGVNLQEIKLVYRGKKKGLDYRGVVIPAGTPARLSWMRFKVAIDWSVKWFAYDSQKEDPRTNYEGWIARASGATAPVKTMDLNYDWWGEPAKDLPRDYFGTLAEGTFEISPGRYTLNVTSDDGVRVWVDGKKVIENWTYHGPTLDTASLQLGGKHTIKLEHFELNGFSSLKVGLEPVR